MIVISDFNLFPQRFISEYHNIHDKTEQIYRQIFSFVRILKNINTRNVYQINAAYQSAVGFNAKYNKLKNKSGIGTNTKHFINKIASSLSYCGNNQVLFCSYVRTTIYNPFLLNQLVLDFYNYIQSITFVNHFQNDYDRIVSSSAFRRLQDKAQVFSLESFDYVRTRLTHSNEVAAISEQLVSKLMFGAINTNTNLKQVLDLKEISKCASLLHDIGNPPFGHYGEHVIKHFFELVFSKDSPFVMSKAVSNALRTKKKAPKDIITSKRMINDFIAFDGNAQAFRIVNNLQQYRDKSTLNLTASTLLSIIKYPCDSTSYIEKGKFGYFYSEQEIIDFLRSSTNYTDGWIYLPALIMETSDDISYNISDFEDSCKKGLISYEDFATSDLSKETNEVKEFVGRFLKYYKANKNKYKKPGEVTLISLIQDLKIKLISESAFVINGSNKINTFLDRTKTNKHVLECTPSYSICKFIKKTFIKPNVYSSRIISENELEADSILSYLLNEFTKAVLFVNFESQSNRVLKADSKLNIEKYRKIINLISPHLITNYIRISKKVSSPEEKLYYRLKIVVDYISGMTDSYCKYVYNVLKG